MKENGDSQEEEQTKRQFRGQTDRQSYRQTGFWIYERMVGRMEIKTWFELLLRYVPERVT